MIEAGLTCGVSTIQARCVEDVSCCIVREYLSRKGLRDTLAKMDKEFPRNEGCFTARDQLIKAAFMERLVRDNKARDSPFRALLEMLVCERLQKKSVKGRQSSKPNFAPPASAGSRHAEMNFRNASNHVPAADKGMKSDSSDSLSSLEGVLPAKAIAETERPQSARGRRESGGCIVRRPPRNDIESVHRLISKSQQYREPARTTASTIQRMEEALRLENGLHEADGDKIDADHLLEKYGGNFAGISSTVITRSSLQGALLSARGGERKLSARTAYVGEPSARPGQALHTPRMAAFPGRQAEPWAELEAAKARTLQPSHEVGSPTLTTSYLLRSQSAPRLDATRRRSKPSVSPENGLRRDDSGERLPRAFLPVNNDVEVSDVAFQDTYIDPLVITSHRTTFRPITRQEAVELKELLFGTRTGTFGEEWASQGFTFTKSNAVPYGLLQKKGGPCGVLAAVQAYMIKELLWPKGATQDANPGDLQVDVPRRNAALTRALAFILWQAGDSKEVIVANPTGVNVTRSDGHHLASDGIIDTLTLSTFRSKAAVQEYYSSCIFKLQEENCSSCVTFLISVLMTHGLKRIREEMDDENSSLIGKHSHCNQEVVNLLLVGKAVTNIFNNEVSFGREETTVLRGITSRSNIGLLSLYEHYKSCQVGSYYKDPKYPIWIVLSENHFSVLFAKSFIALEPGEERFDLFYYDGMNKQEEEVRLTLDPTVGITNEDVVMTPPLELCIRTRWKGALVSWNNAEPLL